MLGYVAKAVGSREGKAWVVRVAVRVKGFCWGRNFVDVCCVEVEVEVGCDGDMVGRSSNVAAVDAEAS